MLQQTHLFCLSKAPSSWKLTHFWQNLLGTPLMTRQERLRCSEQRL